MPASIAEDELGRARFTARKEHAWHALGTVFDADAQLSPEDATIMAHADYFVRKIPLTITFPDGSTQNSDQVALAKEPEFSGEAWKILGYATDQFELLQNMEVAQMLETMGKKWPVETVGALGQGETFFLTLKSEPGQVKGEQIDQYLLVSNNHDGKRALHVALTPVRVVCQNTLQTGLASAVLSAALPHRADIRKEMKFSVDLIAAVQKQQAEMLAQFERLADTRVTADQVEEILEATYPDPVTTRKQLVSSFVVGDAKLMGLLNDNSAVTTRIKADFAQAGADYESKVARTKKLRDLARERYELVNSDAINAAAIKGTAWAVYQGVTESENYRGNGGPTVARAIMFGDRAKTMARAYKACVALAK